MLLLLRKRSIIISEKLPGNTYTLVQVEKTTKKGTSCQAKSLQTTHYPHGKMMLIHHGPTSSRKMSLKHARRATIGQWIDSRFPGYRGCRSTRRSSQPIVILPCMERKPSASSEQRSAISYEIRTKELNCKRGHKAATDGDEGTVAPARRNVWQNVKADHLSALNSRSSLLDLAVDG